MHSCLFLRESFCGALLSLFAASSLAAQSGQELPLDAIASDPIKMGWMFGSPPPPEKLIRFSDGGYRRFPESRWAFSNQRLFVPTSVIARGNTPVKVLPTAIRADLDAVEFTPAGRTDRMTWGRSLLANYTDGIVVLHRGRIVYERYFGVLIPERQHLAFSVTKSFVGLLAAALVAEGALDETAVVTKYVPELEKSGFGTATIRQLMDMATGIRFDEGYANPKADIWEMARAANILPRPAGYNGPESFYSYIPTLQNETPHGSRFAYRTPTVTVLAWVLHRVTGRPFGQLVQERFWSKLGMEQDAYCTVDSTGTEHAGGGLNATVRDFARFGEMVRMRGRYHGQQIVPEAAVADIFRGGNKEHFAKAGYASKPGWSYRSMWWATHNTHGAINARGIHGQIIYIDPVAEMVIVQFASHPGAAGVHFDATSLPAYEAMAMHLMKSGK